MSNPTWKQLKARHQYIIMCWDNLIAIAQGKTIPNPEIEKSPLAHYDLRSDTVTWTDKR